MTYNLRNRTIEIKAYRKRKYHCSRCGDYGHSKLKCPQLHRLPMIESQPLSKFLGLPECFITEERALLKGNITDIRPCTLVDKLRYYSPDKYCTHARLDDYCVDASLDSVLEVIRDLRDLIEKKDMARCIALMAIIHICFETKLGDRLRKEPVFRDMISSTLKDIHNETNWYGHPLKEHMYMKSYEWMTTFYFKDKRNLM